MSVKIVLQNAVAQLEAQKTKTFADAKAKKLTELTPTFDTYKQEQQAKYDEAVASLKTAFDKSITTKQEEIETQAKAYADVEVATIDNSITQLTKMIEAAED
jgi:predicted component of type VI protein secretion system